MDELPLMFYKMIQSWAFYGRDSVIGAIVGDMIRSPYERFLIKHKIFQTDALSAPGASIHPKKIDQPAPAAIEAMLMIG